MSGEKGAVFFWCLYHVATDDHLGELQHGVRELVPNPVPASFWNTLDISHILVLVHSLTPKCPLCA